MWEIVVQCGKSLYKCRELWENMGSYGKNMGSYGESW